MKVDVNSSLNRWIALGAFAYVAFALPLSLISDDVDSESSLQKGLKALALIGCFGISVLNSGALLKIGGRLSLFMQLVLIVLVALSSLYAPDPKYALYSAAGLYGIWGVCNYLVQRGYGNSMQQVLFWSLLAFVGCSWIALAIAGEQAGVTTWTPSGGTWRFVGLAGRPVNMAVASAVMIGLAMTEKERSSWWMKISFVVVGLVTIWLTKSRTPLLVLAAALSIVYLVRSTVRLAVLCVLIVGMAITIGTAGISDIAGQFTRTGRTDELTTLTGRTEIWAYVFDEWKKSPLIGYGYGSTKSLLLNELYMWDFTTESAHNLLLQCLFTLGLMGAAILVLIFLLQARQVARSVNLTAIFLISFVYLIGITEASFIGPGIGLMTVCWLAGGALLQQENRLDQDFNHSTDEVKPVPT